MVHEGDADRFRGLPIGVLGLDADQAITSADATFCEQFECNTIDLLGRTLDDLFSPRDRRASLDYATKMRRPAGNILDMLVTLRLRGREYPVRLRVLPRKGGF